ncbi:hypothetical protein MTF65_18480 [Streptomyces sp. APSN-46.1]|uniref:hypothetical protein n=1 Tax=Streptomyces sp. APSN-46.1 TaxID=2929049 RepID=UPI001FB324CB|nr:hypothetical protein [Streptomyces sp. APSN-46.1]MCJ1679292.1 hypothetical protein [Streptomyces sp. APSN-46.1]
MITEPYEEQGAGDPTAVPAAAGLALLALGGWLLATARPWQRPAHPVALGLGWTASAALLVCGLVLLARCARTVHEDPYTPAEAAGHSGEPRPDPLPETLNP